VKSNARISTISEASSFHLKTAVMEIAADGIILHCNAAAQAMLGEPGPAGEQLADFLDKAEKLGRLAPGTSGKILGALATGSEHFQLLDGRSVLMNATPLADGTLIEWSDVSSYIAASRLDERDPLTGTLTRSALLTHIEAIAVRGAEASVLYVDLDRFTSVNNMLGQGVGDNLLKRVAARISGLLSQQALLARVGGDEFVIVEPCGEQQATALAARLLDMIARPFLIDGQIIHVGASLGLAPVGGGETAETVIRNSRLALLNAKAEGGGSAHAFTDQMRESLQRRRLLEVDLRQALALREFTLAYQPQYEIDSRTLVGFEALLRWHHPQRGHVSPGEFIPLAEDLGLIVPIGEWALRTACKEAATWPLPLPISVNISPLQFRNPNIVSMVTSALAAAGLDPNRLELEVTEGALLLNSEPVMNIFRQLKAIGVRFAMDDFGTGYSSLGYLQQFPFDKIKIDQSFVRNLPDSGDGIAIVRAVSALGSSLGLSIIAEGVETEEQLSCIRQNGCLQVQGYLTGRPLAPNAVEALVAAAAEKAGVAPR
jgi:diguanylate cyclase (GGDEF)-like protein